MLYGIGPDDRMFTVTKSYLHREMDRGGKEAGVPRIRIHDIRHSAVSLLIDMGFSATAIADRVGHESIDITYNYAHLFPSKQAEMADSFVDYKKYHSNKQSYYFIRRTSDRICKEHGLSVIVPGQDKGKSYAEYTAEKQGTSYKAKLKTAIDTLIPQVKDFDELLRRLQEMGYEIKQGKYISFRATGQERFTRAKTLGAAYTEEAIKERIKGVYAAKAKTLREDKKIRLVVDLENSIKAQQSAGYERWAKIHNLKQAAKSMNFLTENKIEYYSDLESKIADIMTAHDAAARAVKEVEQRMSDLSLLIKHTTTYRQLKPIYEEYKKSRDKEKYLRGHESEIILFEAAAKALREMQIKKLPDLAALRKEYSNLNDRKSKLYEDYRQAKKQMQEYGIVKKNVDSILYPSQSKAREQER